MKYFSFLLVGLWMSLLPSYVIAQSDQVAPEFSLSQAEVEAHLRFLASDELAGRRTGEVGNNIAARYLATQFESYGIRTVAGADGYYQRIRFLETAPPNQASLSIGKKEFQLGDDFLVLRGGAANLQTKGIFAGYGTEADFEGKDIQGKMVITLAGTPDGAMGRAMLNASKSKQELVKAGGGLALIELYNGPIPWQYLARFLGRKQLSLAADDAQLESALPHVFLKDQDPSVSALFAKGKGVKMTFSTDGAKAKFLYSQNVIGMIEGTDAQLKEEYLLLTAHYDHVGTGENGGQKYTEEDSIFNGARDNAIGITALLSAAKSLALQAPKRSVLVLAVTGEELGLLGSSYFVEHPLVPLNEIMFDLNTDGGGYNDTTVVGIMGYDRVGAQAEFDQAAAAFGLGIVADPAPEQNLFDRSDNVSFAAKGIPAPSFGVGMQDFDEEIMKYYHQVEDEASSLDFAYISRFCRAYAYCARLIANKAERPFWKAGDKYEEKGKELYEK